MTPEEARNVITRPNSRRWPVTASLARVTAKPAATVVNANAPGTSLLPRMTSRVNWQPRAVRTPMACASPVPRSAGSARASPHHGEWRYDHRHLSAATPDSTPHCRGSDDSSRLSNSLTGLGPSPPAFNERGMPRLVVRRCLGVGGETLEEVLLLAVGYVDSCHLNGAVLGLDLAQLINEVTKLLSEFRLPSPSRLRRNLHGD